MLGDAPRHLRERLARSSTSKTAACRPHRRAASGVQPRRAVHPLRQKAMPCSLAQSASRREIERLAYKASAEEHGPAQLVPDVDLDSLVVRALGVYLGLFNVSMAVSLVASARGKPLQQQGLGDVRRRHRPGSKWSIARLDDGIRVLCQPVCLGMAPGDVPGKLRAQLAGHVAKLSGKLDRFAWSASADWRSPLHQRVDQVRQHRDACCGSTESRAGARLSRSTRARSPCAPLPLRPAGPARRLRDAPGRLDLRDRIAKRRPLAIRLFEVQPTSSLGRRSCRQGSAKRSWRSARSRRGICSNTASRMSA